MYLLKLKAEANTCNIGLWPPSLNSNLNQSLWKLRKAINNLSYFSSVRAKLCFNYAWAEYCLQQTHLDSTTKLMSWSLFVGSYLHVTWALSQWNERKIYFSVVNNNILEHSDTFAHLLGCHIETYSASFNIWRMANDDYWTRTWNISLLLVYMYQLHYSLTHSFMS